MSVTGDKSKGTRGTIGIIAMVLALLGTMLSVGVALAGLGGSATARQSKAEQGVWQTKALECDLAWRIIPGTEGSNIRSVHAISPNDVWGVGEINDTPLIKHWDGSQWSAVSSPQPGTGSILAGVTGIASNDVWAVGRYYTNSGHTFSQTFIIHWNGTAWTQIASPSPGSQSNYLSAVSAVASNDVWAVGHYGDSTGDGATLMLHWDGSSWSHILSPYPQGNDYLYLESVSATGPNDAWAAGYYRIAGQLDKTLILHWDGASWSISSSPNPSTDRNLLYGITAISPSDAWAVGYRTDGFDMSTLTLHWNGSNWQPVTSPNPGSDINGLSGVDATSSNDVWAVGNYNFSGGPRYTLVEHWDGSSWSVVDSPNSGSSSFSDVSALSATDVWAVGNPIEHYSTDCPLPTLTPAPPSSTPTNTPGPPTETPTATATISCALAWNLIGAPNPTTNDGLNAVVVVSPNDIWAVGWKRISSSMMGTLVEHWNGTQWSVISSPVIDNYVYLTGVAAISTNDIWAVGLYGDGTGFPLSIHWDGTQWTQIPAASASSQANAFNAVAAIASNDVWAAGYYYDTQLQAIMTLVEHWDGSDWNVVSSPSPHASSNYLTGITAINNNPNDIWAVGYIGESTRSSMAMHWDGTEWSLVATANPGFSNSLAAVSGLSTNDVWAVGARSSLTENTRTLIEHWDGTQWTAIADSPEGMLYGVTAIASDNVWAVGEGGDSNAGGTLILHWDGTGWNVVPSARIGIYINRLKGVAEVSASDIWSVGYYATDSGSLSATQVLMERYHDPCFGITPTPTPSVTVTSTSTTTTSTSTSTPTPTTITTTPTITTSTPTIITTTTTPTACSLHFTDVAIDNTFYPFVRCLACRGIVSGYPCGGDGEPCDEENNSYFRPNVNITRGQIAKVVSNSARYNEDPNPQIYEDVDPTSTFYTWINRLSRRGHMGGYPCGSVPEEPCIGPGNRAYFRPFANATRGQLAKIVSNAAGFNDTPVGQMFSDVQADHAFYVWIQRLALRGIMGGYPCGGEGEPCDDENRSYFRPFNNVTRGQSSKIVAGAFFPNCQTPNRR